MPEPAASATPRQTLSTWDGVAFLIGIVIGIGIFKTPSLVAGNVGSELAFLGAWLLGGLIMLIGALCYAELGSAHPDAGGEYHYLSRAYGHPVGLLFGWARGTVIQTGAIAAVAFVYGEYASVLLPLGAYGIAIHALIATVVLTALNMAGTLQSRLLQAVLTLLTIAALAAVIVTGLGHPAGAAAGAAPPAGGSLGLAMVFVLLTYGGWNEAAYLAGEIKDPRRNMVRTLLIGTGAVLVLYMLANLAYLGAFGLAGLARTNPVGADLMRLVAGDSAAVVLSLIVCVCALSTLNATIFTGARAYYALGRDLAALRVLGTWDEHGHKPTNALLLQGAIALVLIGFGAVTRDGFEAMVAYTAPVFWFFLMLVALSVIVFRLRDPGGLQFRVPLYPLPPILLAAAAAWMLYSAVAYAGVGSLVGIAVLLAGTPLLLFRRSAGAT
jgi:amino acid transporter